MSQEKHTEDEEDDNYLETSNIKHCLHIQGAFFNWGKVITFVGKIAHLSGSLLVYGLWEQNQNLGMGQTPSLFALQIFQKRPFLLLLPFL